MKQLDAPQLIYSIHPCCFLSLYTALPLCPQVLNRPVVTLRSVEKVSRIVSVLKSCTYNGFPVVDSIPTQEETKSFKSYGTLRGLILRSQLTVLLKHKVRHSDRQAQPTHQNTNNPESDAEVNVHSLGT